MAPNTCPSIITLKVKGKKCSDQKMQGARMYKKDSSRCCLQESHLRSKDPCRLKVKEWKNTYHTNGCQMKAGVATYVGQTRL